ncbi:MAG: ThuA domain-containing protein [Anaerolineae bacterium]
MKKGLMLAGSFAGFHPADYAYDAISADLSRRGIATLDKVKETRALTSLSGYDLLVIYGDRGELSAEEEQALIDWVAQGGALVGVHGATTCFRENAGYHALLGSLFINHPPATRFNVFRDDVEHMITRRVPESFTVEDELYLLDVKADFQTLLHARYQGTDAPVAYVRHHGKGRVFYCGLGHGKVTLDNPLFHDIIAYGTRWALGQEAKPDVRVALVGYGGSFGMGHLHGTLANMTPGMRLACACDLNPKQMEVAKQDFPEICTYTDAADVAADPNVDFCVVIVPHNAHAPVARQLLQAGKSVMVEKPFLLHGADVRELTALAESQGVTLTTFHNRRWDRDFMAVQAVVRGGEIGTPYHFEAYAAGFGHPGYWWRSDKEISGGMMYDWGAHCTDWGLNVIRDDVDYVMGWAQKRRWFDVTNEDAGKLVAHFKGGQLLEIEFGNLSAAPKAFMRILGTKGAIEVRPAYRDVGRHILVHREGEHGLTEELRPYSVGEAKGSHPWAEWSAVEELYRQLADHFTLGDPVPVTPHSAGRVIGVIEAATLSVQSGRPEPPTYW